MDNLGVITLPDGNRLIVRGGLEILVPESQRKRILSTLHLDHSSGENMIRQVKNKIFWPKLRNELQKTYEECPECTKFRISHPQKSNEVSYRNIFTNFYPNQLLEVDFAQKGCKDYIVIVCSLTGFLKAYQVKNKGSEEAILKIREWGTNFGLPYQVKCDFGPGFRETFESKMKELGVSVIHSSAYNSQSNGLVERGVRSLKHILNRSGRLSELQLHEIMFLINAREQPGGVGSPSSRFLRRGVRTGIPNSLDRSVNWDRMIELRGMAHEKRVQKPGRCSKESYTVGETVLVQNIKNKQWSNTGVITEVRLAHDGTIVSYGLDVQGHPTTRHRRYLRKIHQTDSAATSDHELITSPEQEEQVSSPTRHMRSGRRGGRT